MTPRPLSPAAIAAADRFWAGYLGCPSDGLRPRDPLVLPHGEALADYAGAYLHAFEGAAPVVSLPSALVERFGAAAADAAAGGLAADGRWAAVFGELLGDIVGPAEVRYADRGTFRPVPPSPSVRLLTTADLPAVEALRGACTTTEWEHGGSEPGEHPLAGAFADDGTLAALAGYRVWGGELAHVAIVAHPAHRGRGHARAAVSLVASEALERGLVPQYRALAANTHSVAIARRLGFLPHSASLAVRLRLQAPG